MYSGEKFTWPCVRCIRNRLSSPFYFEQKDSLIIPVYGIYAFNCHAKKGCFSDQKLKSTLIDRSNFLEALIQCIMLLPNIMSSKFETLYPGGATCSIATFRRITWPVCTKRGKRIPVGRQFRPLQRPSTVYENETNCRLGHFVLWRRTKVRGEKGTNE